ncbi:MAG TPA: TM1266 family iron-only hydrogenase system putative regulator [Oscillospiraceae bacterium]|nr:TM1266 family iron-only hydrogenase system putative regulator [Oscillospiraceae bacterium]
MENQIAIISVVVGNSEPIDEMNSIFHDYAGRIVGRLGVPYHKRDVSVICIVMDAPDEEVDSFTEKLSALPNVNVSRMYADIPFSAHKE